MTIATMPIFCPNCGTIDYVYSYSRLDPALLSKIAWKVYGQHFQDDSGAVQLCGVNAWPSLVSIVPKLAEANCPLVLEVGACKPWSLDGVGSADVARTIVNLIRQSGGRVDAIAMDEPLAGCVVGASREYPEQLPPERTGDIAAATARWMQAMRDHGVSEIGLIEAYPYHPADRIVGFVRDIVQANGQALAFLELDFDRYACQDQRLDVTRIKTDLQKLRDLCTELGIPWRAIVTAARVTDDAGYQTAALDNFRLLKTLSQFDAFTVQSWLRNDAHAPGTIPNNQPTHLNILKTVIGG